MKRRIAILGLAALLVSFLYINWAKSKVKYLNPDEAKAKILSYLNSKEGKEKRSTNRGLVGLEQINVADAWEKSESQVFRTNYDGTYLIQNNKVIPLPESGNMCVADIDDDGRFEFLYMYGWGSGIYRIDISAYRDGKQIASNCWVPKSNIFKLFFEKTSDKSVKLCPVDYDPNKTDIPKDYGKLKTIRKGKVKLIVPENLQAFPYKEWNYN